MIFRARCRIGQYLYLGSPKVTVVCNIRTFPTVRDQRRDQDYPWRLEACERVYTPRGVEQVMDVTGLPGVIICNLKAL